MAGNRTGDLRRKALGRIVATRAILLEYSFPVARMRSLLPRRFRWMTIFRRGGRPAALGEYRQRYQQDNG